MKNFEVLDAKVYTQRRSGFRGGGGADVFFLRDSTPFRPKGCTIFRYPFLVKDPKILFF